MTKQASSLELFVAAEKVARHTEEWNATTVIERVRESAHATDDDIITFAETFVDGPYREKEEGASFAHLFERMLREGPGIIDEQLEAVEHERKRRREEAARAAKDFRDRGPEFDDLLRMLLGEDFFGALGEDFFDDDTKSTATVNSTRPRPIRAAPRVTRAGTRTGRRRSSLPRWRRSLRSTEPRYP